MTTKKSLLLGCSIAPLSVYPITFLSVLIYYVLSGGDNFNVFNAFIIATVGLIIIAYPATIILCLTIYFCSRNKTVGESLWLYVLIAISITGVVTNSQLFDEKGLFGLIYLGSAASCSWGFWYLAIYLPSCTNKNK